MKGTLRKAFGRSLQRPLGARFVLAPATMAAYWYHERTGRTPAIGYSAMRKLFGSGRGATVDHLAFRSIRDHPPLDVDARTGLIRDDHDEVVHRLRNDGICVLDSRLPTDLCDELYGLAAASHCTLTDPRPGAPRRSRFDPERPLAVRYDVPETNLVNNPTVQKLLTDPSIFSVAQDYLECAPIQDLVAMWWTSASAHSSAAAAQRFHFDLDRLRFVKLFVYLTNVTTENGPHEFVRGSHRFLPQPLRADRRFTDDEVFDHFDREKVVSITGESGTMFFADTRGLHKGLNVVAGHRLVFQLEYASSLFGAEVRYPDIQRPSAALLTAVREHPQRYRRFNLID